MKTRFWLAVLFLSLISLASAQGETNDEPFWQGAVGIPVASNITSQSDQVTVEIRGLMPLFTPMLPTC
jgi:hypothetical protein